MMESSEWKKHVQLKEKNNYTTPNKKVTELINPELL
jgi:hypothetical protein